MDEFRFEKNREWIKDAKFCYCEVGLSLSHKISAELRLKAKGCGFLKKNVIELRQERSHQMLQTVKERSR